MNEALNSLGRAYRQVELLRDVTVLLERFVTGRSVLDVGCANYEGEYGFGLVHSMILERCACCVGVDISPAVLRLPASSKVRYFQGNAETFSLNETFDTIFCGDVIEHLSNPGQFLSKAAAMMRQGSDLILITPNPYGFRSIVGLFCAFEPPIHPEHTILLPISGMNELASRHALRLEQIFLIKGQVLMRHDRLMSRAYKLAYRVLLSIPGASKFADTFAFRLVRAT